MSIIQCLLSKKRVQGNDLTKRLRSANLTLKWANRILPLLALFQGLSLCVAVVALALTRSRSGENFYLSLLAILTVSMFVFLFGYSAILKRLCRKVTEEAPALCETATVQEVDILLERLEIIRHIATIQETNLQEGYGFFDYRTVEKDIWYSLLHLLSRIEANEPHLLNGNSHRILQDILTVARPYMKPLEHFDQDKSRMHYAIVQALQNVGDSRDLPALRRVAAGQIKQSALYVCKAAREAIESIESRLGMEEPRQQLLRPSQSPVDYAQELLRPVGDVPDIPKQELLRAVENRQHT